MATIVIQPGGFSSDYSPKSVSLQRGGVLKIVNKDSMRHSVTSVAVDSEGDPLFDVVVEARTTGTLVVPQALSAGRYSIYCTFHPNMQGTLVVTGKGGAAPEPPKFEQALRIPEVLTGRNISIRMQRTKVQDHADRARDVDVDLRRDLSRTKTIRRPAGSLTKVRFIQ